MRAVRECDTPADADLAEAVDEDILAQGTPIADLHIPRHVNMRGRIDIDTRADACAEQSQNTSAPGEAGAWAQTDQPASRNPRNPSRLFARRVLPSRLIGGMVHRYLWSDTAHW